MNDGASGPYQEQCESYFLLFVAPGRSSKTSNNTTLRTSSSYRISPDGPSCNMPAKKSDILARGVSNYSSVLSSATSSISQIVDLDALTPSTSTPLTSARANICPENRS
ncbi:hypothetical protein HZH68_016936 [Vespula germanica]|uniref:Uncharacterized protein n=1 Tax=Vespula germanica TaxID=30212 RepID=A0A834J158_VESGE|nr:hypothetical protein HZH68_016936 [Vespula germanica]